VVSTLHEVRRLAVELRPAALDDFGLAPAIERLVDTHRQDASIAIDLEIRLGDRRLPADVETTMYRIVQEALTNIAKHAAATKISVLLTRTPDAAVLVVEDDGEGFDSSRTTDGLGLAGMRERIALVGGRLRVETSAGSGTTVAAEIPLPCRFASSSWTTTPSSEPGYAGCSTPRPTSRPSARRRTPSAPCSKRWSRSRMSC
jgi:signal transduction histidine kinase